MHDSIHTADSAAGSPLSLFLAAFEGVPQSGSRELRLDQEELQALKNRFPQAVFTLLEESGDKSWYQVTI